MSLRRRVHFILLVFLLACLPACGADDQSGDEYAAVTAAQTAGGDAPATTSVSGHVYRFDWSFAMLPGAEVSVLERPDLQPVVTDDQGFFHFDDLYVGDEATFVLSHPDFFPTQTATLLLDENGLDDVSIQVPPRNIVWALSLFLFAPLNPTRCQIAATVTEPGGTPFSPGIAGVQARLDPYVPREHGPIYFKIVEIPGWPILDLPLPWLDETTGDGGLIFLNVPPGEYVLNGLKTSGEGFGAAYLKCRPGVLTNASPPYGLHPVE